MISYQPLFHTLVERKINMAQLAKDGVVSSITMSKFRKGESIMLSTAEKICKYLNCNIQDIVTFSFEE